MQNKNIKNSKEGHHDDCQDCRREKKQNDALIAIYERLQAIDNNSKLMRKSLQKHKNSFETTNTKFKEFVCKFNQIPRESKADVELKNLGQDLAHAMMEELTKGHTVKENQRLKSTLARMHKFKLNNPQEEISTRKYLSVSTNCEYEQRKNQIKTQANNLQRTSRKDSEDLIKSLYIEEIKEEREPEETRTTGFFSHENQPRLNSTKMEGLNLWLYEQVESKNIEQQLYETRLPTRYRINKASKSKPSVLPALRTTRQNV